MPFKQIDLSIDLIDLADERYRISDPGGEDLLAQSIGLAGLTSLPLVQQKKNGQYRIIAGFKRIAAVKILGWHVVECFILDLSISPLLCWQKAIADNVASRSLSLLEQARAAAGLLEASGSESKAVLMAKPLGLSFNKGMIDKLSRLMALPAAVRKAVGSGRMSFNSAMALENVDEISANMVADLFGSLWPTVSHQQEIITGLYELACLRDTVMADVIREPSFADILSDTDSDRREKLKNFRTNLHKLRYPALSRAGDLFSLRKKNLGLPENIDIIPPPGFESTVYTLTVRFCEAEQLCQSAEKIAAICRHSDLEAILSRSFDENK